MKNVLSKRLVLLGAAGLFALGVAAPVQMDLDSGTLDKAAAYAKGKGQGKGRGFGTGGVPPGGGDPGGGR